MAIRRRHIRQLVAQLLATHDNYAIPVDVKRLAAALNVQIHDETADDTLSGFLVRDVNTRRSLIGVNSSHSETRKRFTIAHEIGHLLLHEGEKLHVDRRDGVDLGLRVKRRDTGSSLGVDDEEKEANLFAAELLMPFSVLTEDLILTEDLMKLKAVVSQCEDENAADQGEDEDIIKALAERYEVSIQAMTFRLTNLGLLHL